MLSTWSKIMKREMTIETGDAKMKGLRKMTRR